MAKVTYYDELLIEPSPSGRLELICAGPHWAPSGKENLITRAAERILADSGHAGGVRITLCKNIPAGTGLGSASSDAAATLLGLNHYLDLGIPENSLRDHAAALDSGPPRKKPSRPCGH